MRLKRYKELTVEDKARILKEYRWSSLPGYLGITKRDEFVTYGIVLGYMGGDTKEGKNRYRDFILSGIRKGIKSPLKEARAEAVLGTDSFIEWIRETFIDVKEWTRKEQPQVGLLRGVIPVQEMARAVGEEYGVRPEEVVNARSPYREARRVLIEMSYRLNMSYRSLQKLGDELGGIGGAAVAQNHNRLQKQMLNDKKLARRVEKIYKSILSQ
ncbi:MAG: hypothetical protein NTZ78_08425 [Candidatus Aureabacteria bacterium]|nr:hypothetical protein [Candidatus Auribacterota bacterium]